jgi:hypothetical protein
MLLVVRIRADEPETYRHPDKRQRVGASWVPRNKRQVHHRPVRGHHLKPPGRRQAQRTNCAELPRQTPGPGPADPRQEGAHQGSGRERGCPRPCPGNRQSGDATVRSGPRPRQTSGRSADDPGRARAPPLGGPPQQQEASQGERDSMSSR